MKEKKLLRRFVLFLLLLPFTGKAYDFEVGGFYYNIISQSDLEVEITYKEIKKSSSGYENQSYIGNIKIPETVNYNNRTYSVTKIGDETFGCFGNSLSNSQYKGCQIIDVSIPSSVKYIGLRAFANSTVEKVEFSEGLKSIGEYAFIHCEYLKKIKIPDSVKEINDYSFYGCVSLGEIIIPDSVSMIKLAAFSECSQLRYAVLGKGVETIEFNPFGACPNLLEVFYTSPNKPEGRVEKTNPNMESYVPSSKIYGFGKDYITFSADQFKYTGASNNVSWTNNIKYLDCEIEPIKTEVNAGDYTQTVVANYSGDLIISIEIPFQYSISPAPLSLTVNDITREYGNPNPTFTCSATGFVPGENLSNIGATPLYQCEATQLSRVGSYRILAQLDAKNYDISYKYGNLTITPAPITATVVPSNRIYGDPNPDFQLSFTGLKNNEVTLDWNVKPEFTTSATNLSSVGEYEVSVVGGKALNYDVIKYNPGIMTILKRDLTAKAKDVERDYGEENPIFQVSYSGFANNDDKNVLTSLPKVYCGATQDSDAGSYPILVEGGSAENYSFIYEPGTLRINPLLVGFQNVYNTVTFDNMSVSTYPEYFNYIPEIYGPYCEEDFYLNLMFMDKDNHYSGHHTYVETSGQYKGEYVETNTDRPMQAGKYIFTLKSKGNNPNVKAETDKCYLTVETANANLTWDDPSVITVYKDEIKELHISYLAFISSRFYLNFDSEIIELYAKDQVTAYPSWSVKGLKPGETKVSLQIDCIKNDFGFYDFYDTNTVSKTIRVLPNENSIESFEEEIITIKVDDNMINVYNKPDQMETYVFDMSGNLLCKTKESIIEGLQKGLYIVKVGNKSKKIIL